MERIPAWWLYTEVLFVGTTLESFRFPFRNPVRTSLWLPRVMGSTPSEIEVLDPNMEIGKVMEAIVSVVVPDFMNGLLYAGGEFYLGPSGKHIAVGKILALEIDPWSNRYK